MYHQKCMNFLPCNGEKREITLFKKTLKPLVNFFACVMVLNATFNNMLAISWRSVLLVEKPGEFAD